MKRCIECNDIIDPPERWTEAGLEYCKKYECMKEHGKKINGVAVVMVHKQGFNCISIEEAKGENFMDASGHR